MQRINSGLPSGDIVSDANALLHSSSAASLSGSNDMNTILGALTSVTQCFSNLQETVTQQYLHYHSQRFEAHRLKQCSYSQLITFLKLFLEDLLAL
jgi:hypothetical protein